MQGHDGIYELSFGVIEASTSPAIIEKAKKVFERPMKVKLHLTC